uniref:hypothetical protein n=1 Tax=Catenella fusiformis TaxID=3024791 RepID=UPI0027D9DD7C|nr:hypothetical protein REQ04_pgp123 [Catenella fusiformis]WCH57504.1 hypothetical protein [Catenella fusiformis]
MKPITLNSSISWKFLPWKRINQRIFTLQEKIYIFAQQCNKKSVHKIQNDILNSSDAKILAIQKIFKDLNKYHTNYNSTAINKFYIYNYLFINQVHLPKKQLIIENIKQYLVYLCLKPEWEARLESVYKFNVVNTNECYFIYRLSNFLAKNCSSKSSKKFIHSLDKGIVNKYINVDSFINKIQSLPSISYYVKSWLDQQNVQKLLTSKYTRKYDKNVQTILNCLDKLIYNIMYNGIEWHTINAFLYDTKTHNIFKNLYFVFDNQKILEVYFDKFNKSKKALKIVESVYNITKFYHCSSSCLSNYKKQECISNPSVFVIAQKYNISFPKNSKWILQIQISVYRYFIFCVKNVLYRYDLLYKLRKNTFLSGSVILKKINNLTISFYEYYYPLINPNNINLLLKILNKIFLSWIKKTKNNILLLRSNNQYLTKQILNFC